MIKFLAIRIRNDEHAQNECDIVPMNRGQERKRGSGDERECQRKTEWRESLHARQFAIRLVSDLENFDFADLEIGRPSKDDLSIVAGAVRVGVTTIRLTVTLPVAVLANSDVVATAKREKPTPSPEITAGGNGTSSLRWLERKQLRWEAMGIFESENETPPT
jgi:hypothetical protein